MHCPIGAWSYYIKKNNTKTLELSWKIGFWEILFAAMVRQVKKYIPSFHPKELVCDGLGHRISCLAVARADAWAGIADLPLENEVWLNLIQHFRY